MVWNCNNCGLTNVGRTWICKACFGPMPIGDIPPRMTAMLKSRPESGYDFVEVEVPEPGEGELLVKSMAVSICGSDMILNKWTKQAATIAALPFTPGHESAGVVVRGGPNTTFPAGTRIAVENHFYCGECYQCQHGRGDICANMSQFGHGKGTKYGGCSNYFIVQEKYCYKITTNISARDAALLEPLGVAHNACERVEPAGEDVLVIGCGPVGLLAIGVCKAMGARKIIATDIIPSKLEMAIQMGADVVVDGKSEDLSDAVMRETDGVGVGRLLEMSGFAPVVNKSFSMLRKGGQIVLVGLPKAPLHVENVLQDIVFKSLTLRTIHGRRIFHTWEETEKLVASGEINLDVIVSHEFDLQDWQMAYDAFESGQACKIVIYPEQ